MAIKITVADDSLDQNFTYKKFGEVFDGFHTFDQLYHYRMLYNAAFFKSLNESEEAEMYDVHKSYYHSDGELAFGGGWFVVVAELPTGQITNHYKEEHWDLFNIDERAKANEWDGHTPEDVAERLERYLRGDYV